MKEKIHWISIIMLFCSLCTFAQSIKVSKQDSLLTLKLFKAGFQAGNHGDFEEAISNYYQVYELRKKIFGSTSPRLAPVAINLGIQYKNLGNLDKAIASLKEAEVLYSNEYGNEYPKLGDVYINLGNIYSDAGDYNKAIEYHRNAFRVLKTDSIRNNVNFQKSKYNIAETQFKLGNSFEAIHSSKSNLNLSPPDLEPLWYDLVASSYKKEGKYDLSEKNYLMAIKSWIKLLGENNVQLADEYLAYSAFLITKKEFEKALIYSSKAKSIAVKIFGKKSRAYAEIQSNFGDYYYMKNSEARQIDDFRAQRKKYLNEALSYYQDAIVSLVDSFQTTDPFIDPPLKNVISEIRLVDQFKKKALVMEKLADIYLSEFDYGKSLRYFNASLNSLIKATQLIHRLQIGFENEESKYFLSQNQEATFYEAIKIAYKLYNQTKNQKYIEMAFEFSERSKSSTLLASVKDTKAKEFGGIPDSLLEKEKNLKSTIATYNALLLEENHAKAPDSMKINMYSSKIFKYNDEYNQLIKSFEKSYPTYYAFKYENKVVGVKEIQSNTNSRQAIVEYFIKEPKSEDPTGELYRFVVTKDSVSFSMDEIDSVDIKNIQLIHDFLINPDYLSTKKKDFIRYAVSGNSLYKKLIKPIARNITGKDLTIIPHDKLSYIPFDALLTQMPDTSVMNFRNLNYLIKDYVVNYSYSATLLYDYANLKKKGSKSLIIFSPQYNPEISRTVPETSTQYYLNPLPGAAEEVKGISKYIKADIFMNNYAQESEFKERVSDFDVLHMAMHTIINDSLPMFSKLVFSQPEQDTKEDGFLNTYEIYNMKLNARLAVLSACSTGSGKLQKGEGVMSMARGFIYAGCPSIVMTLWQVEDKSGVQIMKDFYYYLSKGKRKDVALRLAKLNHLESSDPLTSHPHYWLGYVSIGNPEPLYTSKDIYFVLFVFLAVVLIFADWYIRKRPRNHRSLKK
jgi:CHAT domain-containing protein/tetratricopeptide (TPR) repeat protein